MEIAIALVVILVGFGAIIVIEIIFDAAWVLVQKGWSHHEAGQSTQALSAFQRAIQLKPQNKWEIAGIAQLHRLWGQYESALAAFDQAIALDPGCAWCVANRGEIYRLLGRYESAMADFNQAIHWAPDFKWAIEQAQAQVNNAQLQLSYTTITAPTTGIIGNKTVQVGQRVQPGQTLMSVATQQPWIVANFKETQLGKMQRGQRVEIKIDAFPDRIFTGKVDSLSPASGAKFALLPPDNATGNFTKIVQRLPVKVIFDPASIRGYESRLAPGMSAIVTVATHSN